MKLVDDSVPEGEALLILYTNDIHGNMEKLPHMTTLVKKYRKDHPVSILVDAGDWGSGSPINDNFRGKPMIEIMNAMHYDAAAVGEGDLKWGLDTLIERAREAEFPVLAANLVRTGEGGPPAPLLPYTLKRLPGLTMGIIGLTRASASAGVSFIDIDEALARAHQGLTEEGADFFVILSHAGLEADKTLAQRHPWIHVIVGGHDHLMLESPVTVGNTLIAQGGANGENLGVLGLSLS